MGLSLVELRTALGLTQNQFALMLDIHVSLLKMAEHHRRSLPDRAVPMVRWLQSLLAERAEPALHLPDPENKALHRQQELASRKRKLEKKLAAFYQEQQQVLAALDMVQRFGQDFPGQPAGSTTLAVEAIGLLASAKREVQKPDWVFEAELELVGLEAMLGCLERR